MKYSQLVKILFTKVSCIHGVKRQFSNSTWKIQQSRLVNTANKMSRPKVLITRGDIPLAGYSLLKEKCNLIVWDNTEPIPRSELLLKIVGVDGVFCLLTDKIDDEILAAAGPQLKVIATMSVGVDHLDLKSLKTRNIHVGYTPDVLTDATAELTVALLLATSRNIIHAECALRG